MPERNPFSKPWWKLRTGHSSFLIQLFSTRDWNVSSTDSEKSLFAIASNAVSAASMPLLIAR